MTRQAPGGLEEHCAVFPIFRVMCLILVAEEVEEVDGVEGGNSFH